MAELKIPTGVAMCDGTTAGATPQQLAAALADALANQNPAALAAGELADTITSLHRELQRVQAQQLRHLAVFDARGDASAVAGLSSTAGWCSEPPDPVTR